MPARAIGSGTISFGMVSIPIKLYTAATSGGISFNFLHAKCGSRIKQQVYCPVCNETVERSDLVRGYEFAKDQYVRFENEEIKALEEAASKIIDLEEFVPLQKVDPIYFEKTYYLGPDKGGEKAYRLLADAMSQSNRVALAKYVMRGKQALVLIRPAQGGLMLHTMYYADEVRDFNEIDRGEGAKIKEGEIDLAVRLIDELSNTEFRPEHYEDEYRTRVLELVDQKVEGKEITALAPEVQQAQVIDLMEALKASLDRRGSKKTQRVAASGRGRVAAAKTQVKGDFSLEAFRQAMRETGLEVSPKELERSYNGLQSVATKKKLSPSEVREKVLNLQKDLKLVDAEPELVQGAAKARTLKAARIPMTARDWERY